MEGAVRISTRADEVALVFSVAAIAFLLCGNLVHINRIRLQVSPLNAINPSEPLISGSGFASNAVYPTTSAPSTRGSLRIFGSWLGSDNSTGSVRTTWYKPVPEFSTLVAGYPNDAGNQLTVEVETAKSGIVHLAISADRNPTEFWLPKTVSLRSITDPLKFRIVAVDASQKRWLGFSQPFLVHGGDNLRLLKQLALVILTTVASLLMFLSPGLLLREKLLRSFDRLLPFIFVPVPGLLLLALLGLVAWIGPEQFGPALISRVGLWTLVLYSVYQFSRVPISSFTTRAEQRVLLVIVVLSAIAVAKATYSVGPTGELFGDQISRTLEVGRYSDSRISNNIVQLVALRSRPFSAFAQRLYETWNFSHRGPINGLAASPIVLASPIEVPASIKNRPWTPFDPEGFSAYRISMIVMASCSLLTVFGLATLFLPEDWALFAFLVATTAPFVVHEIYFTWPKLSAASFVLVAVYLVWQTRYFLGGLSLGVGYLCHPGVLVWLPCLVAVLVLSQPWLGWRASFSCRKVYLWSLKSVSMLAGLAICLLLWRRVNGKHFVQSGFSSYLFQARPFPPTLVNWLRSRFDSLCNTLVPLNIFVFDRSDWSLNSLGGPSPPVIQFFLQYWCTLPFGTGIAFFFCGLIRIIYVAFWKARAWLVLVFVGPLVLFTVYWGANISGMLRENLHPWFLGLMIFSVIVWKKYMAQSPGFWHVCNWALLFRGVEILLMLLLPSIWSQHLLVQRQFAPTDVLALVTIFGGTTWLCVYMFRFAEALRTRSPMASHRQ